MTIPWPTSRPAATIAKLPADWRGISQQTVRLRSFHPEDPRLLTARTFGIGWDLNIGALAVKLGLVRADDNLTDLTAHIPRQSARAMRHLPALLSAVSLALGARLIANGTPLATKWDLTLRPRRYSSALGALSAPLAITLGATGWNYLAQRRAGAHSCDVTAAANASGLAAGSVLTILAAARSAVRPRAREPLAAAAVAAIPAVSLAVFTAAVNSALGALDTELKGSE